MLWVYYKGEWVELAGCSVTIKRGCLTKDILFLFVFWSVSEKVLFCEGDLPIAPTM